MFGDLFAGTLSLSFLDGGAKLKYGAWVGGLHLAGPQRRPWTGDRGQMLDGGPMAPNIVGWSSSRINNLLADENYKYDKLL